MNHVAFDAQHAGKDAVFDPTVGQSSPGANDGVYGALNKPEYFHPAAKMDTNNETSVTEDWLGYPGAVQLADINTRNEDVKKMLYDSVKALVKTYKIDGLRFDAARHVDQGFWAGLQGIEDTFSIAEVFQGGQSLRASRWTTKARADLTCLSPSPRPDAKYVTKFQKDDAFNSGEFILSRRPDALDS